MIHIKNKIRLAIVLLYVFLYFSTICFITNCFDYTTVAAEQIVKYEADNSSIDLSDYTLLNYENNQVVEQGEVWKAQLTEYSMNNNVADIVVSNSQVAIGTIISTTKSEVKKVNVEVKPDFQTPPEVSLPKTSQQDVGSLDSKMKIHNTTTGKDEEHTFYDITCSLVQKELNNAHPEALKAQAVAAFTYVKYEEQSGKIPQVKIYNSSSIYSAVKNAVKDVVGVAIVKPGTNTFLYTPYCASTGGATASSCNVWGGNVSHLVSVESIYDEKYPAYYSKTVKISKEDLKNKIDRAYGTNLDINKPEEWIKFLPAAEGGIVDSIFVGKMQIIDGDGSVVSTTGHKFRSNVKDSVLRSASFKYKYENEVFSFTSYGYGHGVGLSQKGADGYARYGGYKYDQILKHYYTGIELKTIK